MALDDQGVDDGQALALGVDDDRVQVDFVDLIGVVGGEAGEGRDQLAEGGAVGGRGAAHAVEQGGAAQLVEQSERVIRSDRDR